MTPKPEIEEISAPEVCVKNTESDIKKKSELKTTENAEKQIKTEESNLYYHHHHHHHEGIEKIGTDPNFKRKIVWFNTLGFLALHLAAVIGVPFGFYCKFYTVAWSIAVGVISGEGVTLGAHRLYSHKAFKATKFTKAILLILQTIAGQNCMYIWVRDHRQHHKFSDTDADPHNANRGFFFSHIGWLMSKKHPEVIRKGQTIDMSDLEADGLVMFQKKYYKPLYAIFALAIPILTPVFLWNENIIYSFFISYMTRYMLILNITWLVNSAAHVFGTKPYDRTMRPVESALVALVTAGEGWHNYHHTFPWDYRAAELGMKFNFTTFVINCLARFGFVYDLKTAPYKMIEHRVLRTGDGTHRTIHPIESEVIADVAAESEKREIQNVINKNDCNSDKNENIDMKQVEKDVENIGGLIGSYEKCMNLFVKGLEGDLDEERNLKDNLQEFINDNNNSEDTSSKNIYSNTTIIEKLEVFELGFGYNMVRQRPI